METTSAQRASMPAWLFLAAIQGNKRVFDRILQPQNQENRGGQVQVTIEGQESDQNHLKSATHMGNTVLHILATYGHYEIIRMICGEDIGSLWKERNKSHETPFHSAAKVGCVNTISALIERASSEDELKLVLRERNKCGETAIHEVTRRDYEGVVDKLMDVDPSLAFELNNDGISPIYLAAMIGGTAKLDDNSMVEKVLHRFQHIDPAMYLCALNQNTARADALLESVGSNNGIIDVKNVEISKGTAIHFLASTGNASRLKLLLESDSSLTYLQDSEGLFPIHAAAYMGNIEVISLLIKTNPDSVELLDHHGRNFFHIAAERNMSEVFTELIMKEQVNMTELFVEHYMKENNISVDIPEVYDGLRDEYGNEYIKNMKNMFIRMINETDDEGNTPLHIAAKKGCKSVMEIIWAINIEYGYVEKIDLLVNRKGFTPFDISVIQVENSVDDSLIMKDCITQYVKNHGAQFTSVYFNEVMPNGEGIDPKNMMDKLQLIGLGAVLITTVAFAAAFQLPGGFDPNGNPVFAKKYIFKAFILSDSLAFIFSALCVATIIYGGLTSMYPTHKDGFILVPLLLFSTAMKCMVLAFGLGSYLMLTPVSSGVGVVILVVSLITAMQEIVTMVAPGKYKISMMFGIDDTSSHDVIGNNFTRLFIYGVLFIFLFALLR